MFLDTSIAQAMARPGTDLVYLMVLDPEGRVVAHNDTTQFGLTYGDAVARRALAAENTLAQRDRSRDGRELLDVATPLAISTKRWGTLRAGFSLHRLEAALASGIRQILGLTAILFVVSLGLGDAGGGPGQLAAGGRRAPGGPQETNTPRAGRQPGAAPPGGGEPDPATTRQ